MSFIHPTIVDIRPEHEIIIVKNQKSSRTVLVGEFMPERRLEELKKLSLKFNHLIPIPLLIMNSILKSSLDIACLLEQENNESRNAKAEQRKNTRITH